MSIKPPFGRLLTAMVTPFTEDGDIDWGGLEKIADHLITSGHDGIVVNGTTGEAPTTSDQEKIEIIKKFKYHSAPQIDKNGIFSQGMYMKVPDAFDIKFYYGNEENRNVNRIGECVLENVNVDYAGSGQWSTFNDGTPNQIKMTLQFRETIIIDKNRIIEGY